MTLGRTVIARLGRASAPMHTRRNQQPWSVSGIARELHPGAHTEFPCGTRSERRYFGALVSRAPTGRSLFVNLSNCSRIPAGQSEMSRSKVSKFCANSAREASSKPG